MEEIWKDIPGYEYLYQVSNYGKIKSLNRKCTTKSNSFRLHNEKLLKLNIDKYGYVRTGLFKNKVKLWCVHRLVAICFIPNPENKLQINHKNGIKTDNKVENLEWCTQSENMTHAYGTGLRQGYKGELNYFHKLKDTQIQKIREDYKNKKYLQKELAKKYNITCTYVSNIINLKCRK
jgi:glucan-binding YG repeat protein